MSSFFETGSKTRNEHLPWTEKYRPSTLDSVVAHEEILNTLRRLMDGDTMPHLLFYGPPGTGKTTTIKACAYHLYGKDRLRANVLELNASDDRSIDVVRHQVREFASTSSIFAVTKAAPSLHDLSVPTLGAPALSTVQRLGHTFKLVVLDEADQMLHDAQAALRRIIEKYTRNVRFCILCNHINKIIPALQSRCTRFRFAPVKKSAMMPRLRHVMESEGVKYTVEGLVAAYRLCQGDLRRCLNILQSSALSMGEVTESSIYRVTGNPTPEEVAAIVSDMLAGDFASCWAKVAATVAATGVSVTDLAREVYPIVIAMDLPQDCKCFLLMRLSDLEYYAAGGAQEGIGLSGILGAFQLVKEAVTQRIPIKEVAGGFAE